MIAHILFCLDEIDCELEAIAAERLDLDERAALAAHLDAIRIALCANAARRAALALAMPTREASVEPLSEDVVVPRAAMSLAESMPLAPVARETTAGADPAPLSNFVPYPLVPAASAPLLPTITLAPEVARRLVGRPNLPPTAEVVELARHRSRRGLAWHVAASLLLAASFGALQMLHIAMMPVISRAIASL